jgi:hypothetical protein
MKIKRIEPKSLAKVLGFLYAIFGFIAGIIISILALSARGENGGSPIFGVGAIIFVPLFYSIAGFIGGYITAWIYNFVAKRVGGIEIETE